MTLSRFIDEVDRRLHRLEQFSVGYAPLNTGNEFEEIVIYNPATPSDPNTSYIITTAPASAPENISIEVGSEGNNSFADISWTAPAQINPNDISEYELELGRVGSTGSQGLKSYFAQPLVIADDFGIVGTITSVRTKLNTYRFDGLTGGTVYELRLRTLTRIGVSSVYTQLATFTAARDSTIPSAVTGLQVYTGIRSIHATWDEVDDIDVVNGAGYYEIQIDTVDDFGSSFLQNGSVGATITSFTNVQSQVKYWVRVRAVDASGNRGPWTEEPISIIVGQVQEGDIAARAVIAEHIQSISLGAQTIIFGQMSGNHIAANTLSAEAIKSSSLNTAIITVRDNGTVRVGPLTASEPGFSGFHYLLLDRNGLRLYKNGSSAFSGGTLTAELDTKTGNAFFGGSININNRFIVSSTGEVTLPNTSKFTSNSVLLQTTTGQNIARFLEDADGRFKLQLGDSINVSSGPGFAWDPVLNTFILDGSDTSPPGFRVEGATFRHGNSGHYFYWNTSPSGNSSVFEFGIFSDALTSGNHDLTYSFANAATSTSKNAYGGGMWVTSGSWTNVTLQSGFSRSTTTDARLRVHLSGSVTVGAYITRHYERSSI